MPRGLAHGKRIILRRTARRQPADSPRNKTKAAKAAIVSPCVGGSCVVSPRLPWFSVWGPGSSAVNSSQDDQREPRCPVPAVAPIAHRRSARPLGSPAATSATPAEPTSQTVHAGSSVFCWSDSGQLRLRLDCGPDLSARMFALYELAGVLRRGVAYRFRCIAATRSRSYVITSKAGGRVDKDGPQV